MTVDGLEGTEVELTSDGTSQRHASLTPQTRATWATDLTARSPQASSPKSFARK